MNPFLEDKLCSYSAKCFQNPDICLAQSAIFQMCVSQYEHALFNMAFPVYLASYEHIIYAALHVNSFLSLIE